MTEVVTRFPANADVPEWLFAVEPMTPESVRGRFFFTVACDVIDLPDCYVVMPQVGVSSPSLFTFEGSGCALYAGSKPVHWINQMSTMHPKDQPFWQPQAPGMAQVKPKLGVWRRLWEALKAS